MQWLNINGKITQASEPVLHAANGAFRYGYGLFETMLVKDGHIALAGYHAERLYAGMHLLYFEVPRLLLPGHLEEQVLKTVARNNSSALCRVRLQVFAGDGGLFEINNSKAGFVIECFPLQEGITQLNENGLVTGIANGVRKSADTLSNIKSSNALVYAIAARQAKEEKWNDALVQNAAGNIIESTIANLFWIKNGNVHTPPLTEGCVAGVMRRHIMASLGNVQEKPLTTAELENADGVFLTNAIRHIKWVGLIGDKKYNAQPVLTVHNKIFRS